MLEVTELRAGYGTADVLKGVTLEVRRGEFVALLGANNAGKSTLINCLSGTLTARGGRIVFDGVDLTDYPSHRIVELGIHQVPEGRQLFAQMTVLENLLLGGVGRNAKLKKKQKLEFVFDLFPRLAERRKQVAGTLSGGEQQMVAIGRALVGDPRLLMLDEPSHGLSPLYVQIIFKAMDDLHREGLTILLVEQNLKLATAHASRCYIIERGEIALSGVGSDLVDDPRVRRAYLGL